VQKYRFCGIATKKYPEISRLNSRFWSWHLTG